MGADLLLLGIFGLIAGASTLFVMKYRNSRRHSWITEMEDERRQKRFQQTKTL